MGTEGQGKCRITVDSCDSTHWLCLSGEAPATISTSERADHASKAQQSDLKLAREAAADCGERAALTARIPATCAHSETLEIACTAQQRKEKCGSGGTHFALCFELCSLHIVPRYLTGSCVLRTTRKPTEAQQNVMPAPYVRDLSSL